MIGILAGMGPRSTAPFVDMVVTECQRQYGARADIDFPQMMICSQPAPFYEDRPTDHAALEAAIRDGLRQLERSGAAFLAIACNTAHIYYPSLAQAVGVPLLNMVELAVAALPAAARRVALIAAQPTMEAGIYQRALQARGFAVVTPDWQPEVNALLAATRTGPDRNPLQAQWQALAGQAAQAGADTLLVACLDLSAVAADAANGASPIPVVDGAQALAAAIVREWLSRRGQSAGESAPPAPTRIPPFQPPAVVESRRAGYTLSTDPARIDVSAVHAYLTRSYWAEQIPYHRVAQSLAQSLNFGLYAPAGQQVGFARVITDHATFAYLCDVYVLEEHRGHGLGKWLVEEVARHPSVTEVRRFVLATADAHTLYAQFGFTPLTAPERFMEILRADIYQTARPA